MTTALLVVDVQESFRARPGWEEAGDPDVARTIGRVVDAARDAAVPVFWILHTEPGTGNVFDPEAGHVRVMSELQPAPDEPVIPKTTINAFTSTDLEARLRELDVDELLMTGIRTEQCCETTTRLAADLGFAVSFVLDATTTTPAGGLSPQQIIERTAVVLAEREFATVTSADDVVARLAADRVGA